MTHESAKQHRIPDAMRIVFINRDATLSRTAAARVSSFHRCRTGNYKQNNLQPKRFHDSVERKVASK
jgi:hypothetical protein